MTTACSISPLAIQAALEHATLVTPHDDLATSLKRVPEYAAKAKKHSDHHRISPNVHEVTKQLAQLVCKSVQQLCYITGIAEEVIGDGQCAFNELLDDGHAEAALIILSQSDITQKYLHRGASALSAEFAALAWTIEHVSNMARRARVDVAANRGTLARSAVDEEDLLHPGCINHNMLIRRIGEVEGIILAAKRRKWRLSMNTCVLELANSITKCVQPFLCPQLANIVHRARRESSIASRIVDRGAKDRLRLLEQKVSVRHEIVKYKHKIRGAQVLMKEIDTISSAMSDTETALQQLATCVRRGAFAWAQIAHSLSEDSYSSGTALVRSVLDKSASNASTQEQRRSETFQAMSEEWLTRLGAVRALCASLITPVTTAREKLFLVAAM